MTLTEWHDFDMAMAERIIASTYGDKVSVWENAKTLTKFGRISGLGTAYETVWEFGGDETYVTDDVIDTVSSSDAADVGTVMFIEGHTGTGTGTGEKFRFKAQTVTLNGQSKVTLDQPIRRVSRAFVVSGTLAGDFYVYEDDTLTGGVPNDSTKVHLTVEGATSDHTQSFKAATTFSDSDYAILTGAYFAITKKQAGLADFVIEVRTPGGVFRPASGRISLNSAAQNSQEIKFKPYLIVAKNSDIRVRAIGSATGIGVDATFQCYLGKVK